jgi:uncharacterized membrane protein
MSYQNYMWQCIIVYAGCKNNRQFLGCIDVVYSLLPFLIAVNLFLLHLTVDNDCSELHYSFLFRTKLHVILSFLIPK